MSSRTAAHRPLPHGNRSRREAPQPVAEIRSLTGLRIVAALWVVLFHISFAPGEAFTRYWEPVAPLIRHGALGVDLFFVISGFVITLTYLDKLGSRPSAGGWIQFWWARVCRIWPVHALVTALFGVWLVYKASTGRPGPLAYQTVQPVVDFPHWVEQMLMVQMWHREALAGSSWVGPAWSISAEWAAYTLFPVLVLVLWRLRNAHPALLGALGVAAMLPLGYLSTTESGLDFPYSWALRIGSGFLSGALICLAVRRIRRTEKVDRIAAGVAVFAVVEVLVLLWADSAKVGSTNNSALAAIAFPVIVGALALSTRGPSRLLSTDTAVLGGKISFALYLVHIPVFEIGYTLMEWHPRLAPGTGLGTLLLTQMFMATLVLAYLVHRFVEEPARRSMRGFGLPGRTAAVPAPRAVAEQPDVAPRPPLDATDRIPAARAGAMAGTPGS